MHEDYVTFTPNNCIYNMTGYDIYIIKGTHGYPEGN